MHILRKILLKLCVGTCLLEPNVATPLLDMLPVCVLKFQIFSSHCKIKKENKTVFDCFIFNCTKFSILEWNWNKMGD